MNTSIPKTALLTISNLSKRFPGVQALDNVSMDVLKGEIHGLIGENGAGKSTLINIIGGTHQADTGDMFFNGKPYISSNPSVALNLGIAIVYQELSLCENMNIADNLLINRHPRKGPVIDRRQSLQEASLLLSRFKLNIRPTTSVRDLPLAVKEQIEILRAVSYSPKLLILDEPTGPLSKIQAELLFDQLLELKKEDVTILYISHYLSEVLKICDKITILRDGKYVDTLISQDTKEERLASLMVGRDLGDMFPERSSMADGTTILDVRNLSAGTYFEDISFTLKKGEILGVAGLVGAGRTEMALTIFGAMEKTAGTIILSGEAIAIKNPKDAIRRGIAYLSEDRKLLGLFLQFSIAENILSVNLRRFSKRGLVDRPLLTKEVEGFIESLSIKAVSSRQLVSQLSGGNQQKTLFAKWVSLNPKVLIIDEPTRGVDIGAKKAIHELLRNLAKQGISVIMISSELPEVLGMSDRIMIMDLGKIVEIMPNDGAVTEEYIMNTIIKFRQKGLQRETA